MHFHPGGHTDQQGGKVHALYKAILRAEWCEERDISSDVTLSDILREQGLDSKELLQQARAQEIGALYTSYTDEAVRAGVFGSPSYVYDGELFWGQDRLDMLEETIAEKHKQA